MSEPQSIETLLPHYAGETRLAWIVHEIWDHLWPWSVRGFRRGRFLQALSLGAAVAVTVVWGLAAAGHIAGGAVIGWWAGWSAFEIPVRMQSKPYIKHGPWWGRDYRPASFMDMACYVMFKNLLVGAVLFLGLKALGLLAA
ncbi:MAG TPA: hypothetical protein VFP70_15710 [Burkholderiales bacterium]|nr:hypothetical protein [Burkholderiales bacterium]